MPSKSAAMPPRNFDSAPGLSDEARQAVNAAFDAMATWRIETANASERNIEQVIEKTAAAAALKLIEKTLNARGGSRSLTAAKLFTRLCASRPPIGRRRSHALLNLAVCAGDTD
jgi:hypothetical protein